MDKNNRETQYLTVEDVEVNALYMMSQAMDLMLRDVERRLRAKGQILRHESKRIFTRFTECVRGACINADTLDQHIAGSTAPSGYKDYNIWQEEANELARLMLLYADRCGQYPDRIADVFSLLNSYKTGAGIIDEAALERFRLK